MNRLDLSDVLRHAVDDTTSSQDPHSAWSAARRRRRRTATMSAAATVAAVSVVLGGVQVVAGGGSSTPAPAPSPTTSTSPPPTTPSQPQTPTVRIDPTFDPSDWSSLPEYTLDLGYWASPERPTLLEAGSIDRARTAISYETTPTQSNLLVIDDDGRWFGVDTDGIEFANNVDAALGLSRRSLSPDGTRLAIGQADSIVVIDLITTETRTYPISDLPPVWEGREVSWNAAGTSVFLARTMPVGNSDKGYRYPNGYQLDLDTGATTLLEHDPDHAVTLSDGTVIANQWGQDTGDNVVATDTNGTRTPLDDVARTLGAATDFAVSPTNMWAVRREARMVPDLVEGVSGFMAFDGFAPLAALPVKDVENNGGGGELLGWLTSDHAVFSMPVDEVLGPATDVGTVIWDVRDGTLWRGPLSIANARISISPR